MVVACSALIEQMRRYNCVMQTARLVKLLANKGRKKQEMAAATGCCISIPATDDWDEDEGVTITFTGGDIARAQQLVLDFLG